MRNSFEQTHQSEKRRKPNERVQRVSEQANKQASKQMANEGGGEQTQAQLITAPRIGLHRLHQPPGLVRYP